MRGTRTTRTAGMALVALLLVFSFFVAGCSMPGASAPTPAPAGQQGTDLTPGRDIVSASGTVLPAQRATLSLPLSGRVVKLNVQAGDTVTAGQALVQLEAAQLQAAADLARANLDAAQAQLDQVSASPRAQQIAAGEAAVAAAAASLKAAQAELKAADAGYQVAQQAQKTAELQVAVARAGVQAAQAQRARVKAGPGPEAIAAAQAQMEKADALRGQAQAEYDKISWAGGAGASPQAAALQQATADYVAARANYQALLAQPRAEDTAIADAAVVQAEAQAAAAQGSATGAASAAEQAKAGRDAVAAAGEAAQAGVDRAKAELDLLKAGATAGQLAAARAGVAAARAALTQAEAALAQATLLAPFAGTVGEVLIREGELVMPATPLIELGDMTRLRVETTDLNEIDLYKLEVGQTVDVSFDALPQRKIAGKVTEMASKATRAQAGTNYTVVIELAEQDPLLRWGMTAFIDVVR